MVETPVRPPTGAPGLAPPARGSLPRPTHLAARHAASSLGARLVRLLRGLGLGLVGLALLSGCSSIRLAYDNGPRLAWWWLDGYVDFSREQAPQAQLAIERWFDWHRSTQLEAYALWMVRVQDQLAVPLDADGACRWQQQLREALEPAVERAIAEFAPLVPGLGEAQFRHLQDRYEKTTDEMRNDFLQPDAAQRQRESVRRLVERAERLYGRLGPAQLQVIRDGVAQSPFSPEAWIDERLRRQSDTLATLRRLVAEGADLDTRVAALRALAARTEFSPHPPYRAYQQELTRYNCAFTARIHNATTPEQRQRARERVRGWETDLRALVSRAE